jgi:hypothetical protein
MAAVGMNPCTDLDANLALRVAPLHRDILALAVRRELPVTNTAVVAARPRWPWCATTTERSITVDDITVRNDKTGDESSLLVQSFERLRMIEKGKSRQWWTTSLPVCY